MRNVVYWNSGKIRIVKVASDKVFETIQALKKAGCLVTHILRASW